MKKNSFFLFVLILCINFLSAQNPISIIPTPVKLELTKGSLSLTKSVSLEYPTSSTEVEEVANELRMKLQKLGIQTTKKNNKTQISAIKFELLKIQDKLLGKEGYLLEVNEKNIILKSNTSIGLFYGVQSLIQLFPPQKLKSYKIPCVKILDYPRFGWRGLMLDVSRHFFSVDDVKKYIDKMAEYKFNTFHWHLTDDEGWRIEIKSLPKLTEIGAWRVERFGKFGEQRANPQPGEKATYGGFYTHEQIKDVVAYAMRKNITIVPEIDMPGHCMAVLAAYPELSVKKEPKFVNPGAKFAEWYGGGKFKMLIENTLDPSNEKVYEFVDKVMTEVAALFPNQYIHMGGDECYKGYWEEDTSVKEFMKKNNIKDSHELQSYFVKRVEKIIRSKGKTLMGWDEILEGGLADGATVMSWRGMKGGIEAAQLGHAVVMSPTDFAYLDYTQGDRSVETNIYADLYLEKCYEFDPLPAGVDKNLILGGQANLWTEAIPHLNYAMYMTYPRALAIAESVWSPKENKNWENFLTRVENHFLRFDADGTHIAKVIYDPVVDVKKDDDKYVLTLKSQVKNASIKYSIDNTYPLNGGSNFETSFELPPGDYFLRTQLFRDGKPLGRMLQISRGDLVKRAK